MRKITKVFYSVLQLKKAKQEIARLKATSSFAPAVRAVSSAASSTAPAAVKQNDEELQKAQAEVGFLSVHSCHCDFVCGLGE